MNCTVRILWMSSREVEKKLSKSSVPQSPLSSSTPTRQRQWCSTLLLLLLVQATTAAAQAYCVLFTQANRCWSPVHYYLRRMMLSLCRCVSAAICISSSNARMHNAQIVHCIRIHSQPMQPSPPAQHRPAINNRTCMHVCHTQIRFPIMFSWNAFCFQQIVRVIMSQREYTHPSTVWWLRRIALLCIYNFLLFSHSERNAQKTWMWIGWQRHFPDAFLFFSCLRAPCASRPMQHAKSM